MTEASSTDNDVSDTNNVDATTVDAETDNTVTVDMAMLAAEAIVQFDNDNNTDNKATWEKMAWWIHAVAYGTTNKYVLYNAT